FGMYLLARELDCAHAAAVFAGAAFGFSPFLIVWLSHPVTSVFVWLPCAVWLLERTQRTGHRAAAAGLALVVAACMLSGHPGSQLHVVFALVVYLCARSLVFEKLAWRDVGT